MFHRLPTVFLLNVARYAKISTARPHFINGQNYSGNFLRRFEHESGNGNGRLVRTVGIPVQVAVDCAVAKHESDVMPGKWLFQGREE
jgi:hypothetical protein